MNVEHVLNSLGEIQSSFQSILVELRDALNSFRAELENDPSMSSMKLTVPRRLYLVNGRTEELLSNGTEETISRYAAVIQDHVDDLEKLESDLCGLVCHAYQEDFLFVPSGAHRLVARKDVPTDRDDRFAYWNETLKGAIISGFEIERTDVPFPEVSSIVRVCECMVSAIELTRDSNNGTTALEESAESQHTRRDTPNDFIHAFASVYVAGIAGPTVAEIRHIYMSNLTCNEKLTDINSLLQIPPNVSSRALATLAGVSHTAVQKTNFWKTYDRRRTRIQSEGYETQADRARRPDDT